MVASAAISDFLLTQELPALEEAVQQASESLRQPYESKECPHLKEILPTELRFELAAMTDTVDEDAKNKTATNARRRVVIKNPVHALHLASQMDASDPPPTSVWYGDEQERTVVLKTPGFSSLHHGHLLPFEKKTPTTRKFSVTNTEKSAAVATATSTDTQPASTQSKTAPTVAVQPPPPALPTTTKTGTTSQSANKILPPAKLAAAGFPPPPPLTTPSSSAAAPPPTKLPMEADQSAIPVEPDKSNILVEPDKSKTPAEPDKSNILVEPDKSKTPAEPDKSDIPEEADKSKIPAEPDKSKLPTAPASSMLPSATSTEPSSQPQAVATAHPPLDDEEKEKLQAWHASHQQIRTLTKTYLSKRHLTGSSNKKVKRKVASSSSNLENMPAYKELVSSQPSPLPEVSSSTYYQAQDYAEKQTQLYLEQFRHTRIRYWNGVKRQQQEQSFRPKRSSTTSFQTKLTPSSVFGAIRHDNQADGLSSDGYQAIACTFCSSNNQTDDMRQFWGRGANASSCTGLVLKGDNLLQCLECSFVGCAPSSICSRPTKNCLWRHCVETNHKIAVSCGPEAKIYCFQCGGFVSHDIFEQEKERIDLCHCLPWMAWTEYPVQRSFDALRFFRVKDQGIFWKGMYATYPMLIPKHHMSSARLCLRRHVVFHGNVERLPETASAVAKRLAQLQHDSDPAKRFSVPAPVGIYNLGNTCFMSAVVQCLIHCAPLQKYFLDSIGHNHESCALYRQAATQSPASKHPSLVGDSVASRPSRPTTVCLACELDKLFLSYLSISRGIEIQSAVSMNPKASPQPVSKGEPLVISDMLTSAWMCKGMTHIAGYAQRDAQEFYLAFMETLGHQARIFRQRVHKTINSVRSRNSFVDHDDVDEISNLFQGTLRSVLVCKDCGNKRTQSESFMNISLPLSKEVKMATESSASSPGSRGRLSVERCLEHFTLPEFLSDPVDCPSCKKKTPTKKQHVVSKLPKILCLHLKRFNGAEKKIEDFVSFPSTGLNMGKYLPHWCEVSRVPSAVEEKSNQADATMPEVLYDLFATVNHFGNLQSGHYVTNVKVDQRWYHVNDAQVEYAGSGSGEAEVLQKEGAYLLFYVRR